MLDGFHLGPDNGVIQLDVVTGSGTSTTAGNNVPIIKPRGAAMLYLFAVGAGGGGGGGAVGNGGGSGGGSGAQVALRFPAIAIPEVLYIRAGLGGVGGASAGGGTAGIDSYILIHPSNSATPPTNDTLLRVNGGGGGATNAGAAGAAGTVSALNSVNIGAFGMTNFLVGQIGAVGGASGAVGNSITYPVTGLFVTGGAGGGGSGAGINGGSVSASLSNIPLFPTIPGGIASTNPGGAGAHSIFDKARPMFYSVGGGGGRGLSVGIPGSIGGAGGYGSGGGGGGSSPTAGGAGGRGGAAIFILAWL